MRIIGITGGVGSGKSEILKFIKDNFKCKVILADDIGNEIKEPGNECYNNLVNLLGKRVLLGDGHIDKKAMAEIIFNDVSMLKKVNSIIHPAVIKRIKEIADFTEKSENLDYFFIEAALLIECGFLDYVDEMWYIYAKADIRRKRLKIARGYSDEKIDSIMANQLSDEEFKENSDFVIDNSYDLENTYNQILKRLSR